jgi:hypothetical protein
MLAVRLCILSLVLAAAAAPARAEGDDAVALLPLDAEARLAIYGQPVASEIARALVQGGIDVVVVGPRMAVPERAKLVVDGTIASKADVVTLSLRVRNRLDGRTMATTQSTAQGLSNIDKAAAELSAKTLPIVKEQIAALHTPDKPVVHEPDVHVAVVAPRPPEPVAIDVRGTDPLRAALTTAAGPWAAKKNHEVKTGGTLAMTFDVKRYTTDVTRGIPYASARVHVKIVDGGALLFDRVVVTDSVLGDKGIAADALAARTAREVLDILRPHLARLVPAWR